MVLGYERLLTNWSRKGMTDYEKLGLVTGSLTFFTLFFDFIIEFQGLRGTSIVGILFSVFLFKVRKQLKLGNLSLTVAVGTTAELPAPKLALM